MITDQTDDQLRNVVVVVVVFVLVGVVVVVVRHPLTSGPLTSQLDGG